MTLHLDAAEHLDRGAVALTRSDGRVYVGWRLLASDPPDIAFDVHRASSTNAGADWRKLNRQPIRDACNFIDTTARGARWFYRVDTAQTTPRGRTPSAAVPSVEAPDGFVRLKLRGTDRAQKAGLADFDGDGRLDYLVKRPDFNTDPYQKPGYWKKSEDTYKLEAYRHDGAFLWRYDMGWAIEEGIWYSPVVIRGTGWASLSRSHCGNLQAAAPHCTDALWSWPPGWVASWPSGSTRARPTREASPRSRSRSTTGNGRVAKVGMVKVLSSEP